MFNMGGTKSRLRTIQGIKYTGGERPSAFFAGDSITVPRGIALKVSFFWLGPNRSQWPLS